jgi:hypothetical protein
LPAMPPDGADVDVVQPPGHLRVGIDAVVAARDAGNFQQGEEIQVDALADVTGELRRFDLGPPLASTGPGLGRDGRPRLVQTPAGAAAGDPDIGAGP